MRRLPLIALLLLVLPACSTPYSSNWSSLRRGMTEDQVRALLGEPRTRFVAADDVVASDGNATRMSQSEADLGHAERWVYGESGLGIRTGLERGFRFQSGNAYHVFFNESGEVISYEAPDPETMSVGSEPDPFTGDRPLR